MADTACGSAGLGNRFYFIYPAGGYGRSGDPRALPGDPSDLLVSRDRLGGRRGTRSVDRTWSRRSPMRADSDCALKGEECVQEFQGACSAAASSRGPPLPGVHRGPSAGGLSWAC
ncbi:hypothetical protein NDU88_004588 [Pleurodeles waltl]|uniref:Uncharacterized protein n=1 Tax=Pleurodeles waltl TaxID=8319 RepID=A0AAV7VHJ0_PLEWA|nr:hypothetical protein NDU88_004588 [Pleurodeles waltl]